MLPFPRPHLAFNACPHCARMPSDCPDVTTCALCRCDYCTVKREAEKVEPPDGLGFRALRSDGAAQPGRLDAEGSSQLVERLDLRGMRAAP